MDSASLENLLPLKISRFMVLSRLRLSWNKSSIYVSYAHEADCKKHGETGSQQVRETYHFCFINEHVGESILYIQALVIYGIDQFLFQICASSHSKVLTFFSESCMKKGK